MDSTFRISFLGDILCKPIESYHSRKGDDVYDYSESFHSSIKNYLLSSDYVIGNLETPIAGKDVNYTNPSVASVFNTPKDFLISLKDIGISMLTTANNHALDRGIYGLCKTLDYLDEFEFDHTGTRRSASEEKILYKSFHGLRFAFLSYTYGMNTQWLNCDLSANEVLHINFFRDLDLCQFKREGNYTITQRFKKILYNLLPSAFISKKKTYVDCGNVNDLTKDVNITLMQQMIHDINDARDNADFVVMCLHIGGQYNNDVGAYTEAVMKTCIDSGCNIVIGNHPHCVHKSIYTNESFSTYALGNFYNTPFCGYYIDGVYSDYSIICNLVFDRNNKGHFKVTYTVTKCVRNGLHTTVYIVSELYESLNTTERKSLMEDTISVIERFYNKPINRKSFEIKREYEYGEYLN